MALAGVLGDARCRIHDREVCKRTEETCGGNNCESLQPSGNHYLTIDSFYTADEDVEAIYNKGRVEIS